MAVNPFLKQNKKERKPIKIQVSDLFVDENGKPVPFILKILSSEEAEDLKKECMEPVFDPRTRRKVGSNLNQDEYQNKMLAKSVVYPDLTDKENQKSWGARDEYDLLFKMLDFQERATLLSEFDKNFSTSDTIAEDAEAETKNE